LLQGVLDIAGLTHLAFRAKDGWTFPTEDVMGEILVRRPNPGELEELDVRNWEPWESPPTTFDWEYDEEETAYVLEGLVRVRTSSGEVEFAAGDLVTFPAGLKCTWTVIQPLRKVYDSGREHVAESGMEVEVHESGH
jgi:uncharacterized protein